MFLCVLYFDKFFFSLNVTICILQISPHFVSDKTTENIYIMMEARLGALFKSEEEYAVLEK